MPAKHKDATFLIRINAQLLAQAKERAAAQGVPLSRIITAALQDYVRYGTTRPPPEPEPEDEPTVF
jgi:predicted DNA binding CopG/RHH family protein